MVPKYTCWPRFARPTINHKYFHLNFNGKQYIEIEILGNKILQIGDIATETLILWTRWHLLDIALPPKLLPPILSMISPTFEITVE